MTPSRAPEAASRPEIYSASVLGVEEATDKSGKKYYKYEVFTRTADGDEGGRYHLVAAVSGGGLWILKVQAGDKRWFQGTDIEALGV